MMDLLHKLSSISEMGYKSGVKMPYAKAKGIADEVRGVLTSLGVADKDIVYGGSLRRQANEVGDVDILIFDLKAGAALFQKVIDTLREKGHEIKTEYTDPHGQIRKMQLGDTQTSFLVDGENVDIKRHDPSLRGAMMLHATGNKDFNIGMRAWLKRFGWGFSQAGLKNDKGEVVAAETEEDIFKALGMPFIEPKDRTGFPTPKTPPPGAKQDAPRSFSTPKGDVETAIPKEIWDKVPDDVKARLKDYTLPPKDDKGNSIPRDFMHNPSSRHKYYKMRGTYRLPSEFKLDKYAEEAK